MGVAIDEVRVQADDAQQLLDALLAGGAVAEAMDGQRLTDDVAHGHARVQRGVGVLEDHLHVTARLAHVGAAHLRQFAVGKLDGAGRRLFQLEDGAPGGGLATAALAHQAERLTLVDVEADAVDGLDVADRAAQHAAADGEVLLQVAYLDENGASGCVDRGSGRGQRARNRGRGYDGRGFGGHAGTSARAAMASRAISLL